MKKPRNFDKINKIKFSSIYPLLDPEYDLKKLAHIYNKNNYILETSNITIYDKTPLYTHSHIEETISELRIVNEGIVPLNQTDDQKLTMLIDWQTQMIQTTGWHTHSLYRYNKKFESYQALNVYQFVQLCIYPICIHLYYECKWEPWPIVTRFT